MKTLKFKTNAKCRHCVMRIAQELDKRLTFSQWSIELATPEHRLTVTSDYSSDEIIRMVSGAGYRAEEVK